MALNRVSCHLAPNLLYPASINCGEGGLRMCWKLWAEVKEFCRERNSELTTTGWIENQIGKKPSCWPTKTHIHKMQWVHQTIWCCCWIITTKATRKQVFVNSAVVAVLFMIHCDNLSFMLSKQGYGRVLASHHQILEKYLHVCILILVHTHSRPGM